MVNIINCQECQQSPAVCWDKTHNVEESAEGRAFVTFALIKRNPIEKNCRD